MLSQAGKWSKKNAVKKSVYDFFLQPCKRKINHKFTLFNRQHAIFKILFTFHSIQIMAFIIIKVFLWKFGATDERGIDVVLTWKDKKEIHTGYD